MATTMTTAPVPGWYLDPADESGKQQRYWDGSRWTADVSRMPFGRLPLRPAAPSRRWAIAAHLASLLVAPFVGPLIVYLLRRDRDPFAQEHAAEAANFGLTLALFEIAGGFVLGFLLLGLLGIAASAILVPFFALCWIAHLVLVIRAVRRAAAGDYYAYPVSVHLFA